MEFLFLRGIQSVKVPQELHFLEAQEFPGMLSGQIQTSDKSQSQVQQQPRVQIQAQCTPVLMPSANVLNQELFAKKSRALLSYPAKAPRLVASPPDNSTKNSSAIFCKSVFATNTKSSDEVSIWF